MYTEAGRKSRRGEALVSGGGKKNSEYSKTSSAERRWRGGTCPMIGEGGGPPGERTVPKKGNKNIRRNTSSNILLGENDGRTDLC